MSGKVGKTRNIWLVWLVWPILTLGIYHLVWWYKINREARDFAAIEVRPAISVVAITLGAIIIVPPWVSIYRTGERIGRMQAAAGQPVTCNGVIGLIASIFLGLHVLYYQYELNKTWEALGASEGTILTLAGTHPADPGMSGANRAA
jgi:DMSO/TMAO reductase YedYZ heme-binding membrane subunit